MTGCPWKIRWTYGQDLACEKPEHLLDDVSAEHAGTIRNYAYDGSQTLITWQTGDRREFTGEWPGPCTRVAGCILHTGHHGRCAP